MPLKLNVGVSRKLGLPEFSSAGASCNIEVELDSNLLHDLEAFHAEARNAFIAAQQAVHDELARLKAQSSVQNGQRSSRINGDAYRNGSRVPSNGVSGRTNGARDHAPKPATENQVNAIIAIGRARDLDLVALLHDEFGLDRPEELTLGQASKLIDDLKAAAQR